MPITIIMGIVEELLGFGCEILEERQSQRELLAELVRQTENQELIDELIRQYLAQNAIDLENRQWWQERFRALGDVFDGDAWDRLRELLKQSIDLDIGENPPESADPPRPGPVPDGS